MGTLKLVGEKLAARQDFAVVAMLMLTLALMVMPLPPLMADVLISCNIALSVLLLMAATQVATPMDFSTLPSLILLSTVFRLALSITTSRMVLVDGDAGEIIHAFGEFVIAGNVVVGLVVYLIITIVQFLVVAKGSERVAEVAARFMLDSLPGRQISIDTDLKNGDIDKDEARRRRSLLATESKLFGSMDGAMKFVKGDAIASLVIIVINLIGGIIIGVLQRNLSFGQAVHQYSLLAVGDGLIAQIPALLVSLTAGLTVTRASSEEGGNLGRDIARQMTALPQVFTIGAIVLLCLGFVPGFPLAVFLTLALIVGAAGWALSKRAAREAERVSTETSLRGEPDAVDLTLALGASLREDEAGTRARLEAARKAISDRLGIVVPRLHLASEALEGSKWRLDIDGVPTEDGGVESTSDLVTEVSSALVRSAGRFVGIQETQRLIRGMERNYGELVRETLKAVPIGRISSVLRLLLEEGVSIRNLRAILEICQLRGAAEQDTPMLSELARYAVRSQICFDVAGPARVIPILLLEPSLEQTLHGRIIDTLAASRLTLDETEMGRLISVIDHYARQLDRPGVSVAILASIMVRRKLALALKMAGRSVSVLSHDEIPPEFRLELMGTVQSDWLFTNERSSSRRPPLAA